MTKDEFVSLCLANNVAPEIALEDEEICNALQDREDDAVRRLIEENF